MEVCEEWNGDMEEFEMNGMGTLRDEWNGDMEVCEEWNGDMEGLR